MLLPVFMLQESCVLVIGRPVSYKGNILCCDINQGFLISRMLLQKMCPYLSHCTSYTTTQTTTEHRFTFLEKCAQDFLGIHSPRSLEVSSPLNELAFKGFGRLRLFLKQNIICFLHVHVVGTQ